MYYFIKTNLCICSMLLFLLLHRILMVVLIAGGWFLCVCAGLVKAPLKRSRSTADGGDEDGPEQLQELLECGAVDEEQKTDNTTLLRLLEEGEKVNKI